MKRKSRSRLAEQLHLPGIPTSKALETNANVANLWPGRHVLYLGQVTGGPDYGARGVVKQTRARKVIVDLGRAGTWHIPYQFLSIPLEAA